MDVQTDLRQAFDADEHELRLRQSKVACVLGIVLIPAGISLDAISYPEHLASLVLIRVLAASAIAVIYALHFVPLTAAHVRYLTMAGLLVAVASIAAMIALTDGASSEYYLGLFLILFAVGVLAPIQPDEAALFCVATVVIYIIGCLNMPGAGLSSKELLSNLYFLILTCIITVTAAHFNYKRRFNEFRLKFKLAAQHEKLSALDRLKSQFFANVSHELRTPLTLILAPVEKIKADGAALDRGSRELLDIIENNALRLLRLVNDILSLIRLEEGSAHLSKKTFDMAQFLGLTTASMKHLAELKNISLTFFCGEGDLLIKADPDAMEKIIGNIVANAIKFTPAGGRIDIAAAREDRVVRIEIRDTGIGIPAEKLPHIFDRFYQVDGSATRRHQGLGLGLALVRELVTRHGGDVYATSESGEGTTFVLSFPHVSHETQDLLAAPVELAEWKDYDPLQAFDRKATARALALEEISVAPSMDEKRSDAPRILVVDDEPDMRRYLVSMLSEDYRVVEAPDGASALSLAREVRPDLMLLDVMLPGVSGLEVCRALKDSAETRGIKIVMLTARADEDAKITALKHGADDFLIKPFSGLEVRTRLANLLRAANLERDLQRANVDLKQSLKQLREAEAAMVQNARLSALGTMAAGLLHEIGNPLNFMGTALQLVARDEAVQSQPGTLETFQDIQAGFDRIRRVVTDLRGFTAPQKPENPRPFDVTDAVEHALRFTAHIKKGVTITKSFADAPMVIGSHSTISQVIVNLLVNAVAAVRGVEHVRKPEILISTAFENRQVIVFVRDNGVGIDPAIQEQIFDPFFSTKEVGEGMGLGLAVSHRIVENHGGSLNVISCLGEWTEFSFNLPVAETERANKAIHVLASG